MPIRNSVTDTRTTPANGRGVLRYRLNAIYSRVYLAMEDRTRISNGRFSTQAGERFLSLALANRERKEDARSGVLIFCACNARFARGLQP